MASAFGSGDGLPAFFTNGAVDDKKYESLLEDLRAHDLLGPAEGSAARQDASAFGASSSLFFNDAFSAVFMGNFSESKDFEASANGANAAVAAKPPPGFARAPPGLGVSDIDLKWARGQQQFSRLEGQFHAQSASARDESDLLDESQIPSLKSLGLDDDDGPSPARSPQPREPPTPPTTQPPTPVASTQRAPTPMGPPGMPPPPPGAWQQGAPHPPHQHMQYPRHVPPPPPPHMQHHPPHMPPPPMHMPPHMRGPPPPPMHMHMRGPPPPGAMPFPPPPGAMHPGAPWPMVAPRFKMMTPRDINFVAQQQMKQIRSSDPFSDDYYFHNYVQKRSRAPVPGAAPAGRGLPLPSWKLEHVKSVDLQDVTRAAKSREWETEHQVLGRNNQRSLYRPKQLLVLSSEGGEKPQSPEEATEVPAGAESAEQPAVAAKMVAKTKNEVFAGDLWLRRQQIDRGMQCLLSLQDARHLLDARGVNVQDFHSMNDQNMDPALAELRALTTKLLLELASLLGVSVKHEENGGVECSLDQLRRMLSVAKGKRLISRALPLLHPSARFVLLPHLIEYLLAAPQMGKLVKEATSNESRANNAEDERLCQTIVLMLLYHPPAPPANVLVESLERAMQGQTLETLHVLLYNRGRAEALQSLLQRGGSSVADADEGLTQRWNRAQEAFVSLATAIKQTSAE
ncbi:hypothetical protein Poli38472_001015 [Pythium oligandrum]|uniref:mRNA decay factor PAT1 domain-containing protein n=1 Tax=Pythium oligandrum TaxID=41045 RepID=A0A8K1CSQ0_PYTOL|nr:hypothetical protein Poli38472_001015 [Pythium oligandrum]|eukprot:TMW68859.1 hypothetical protein Poli38472_001015 [Pythium oligandrum]